MAQYPKAYIHEPIRHPDNPNLRLHYDPVFDGRYLIQTLNGPLVYEYTQALIDQVEYFYSRWPKVFTARVDLYFPKDWTLAQRLNKEPVSEDKPFSKDYFTRFIESLNAKLLLYYKTEGRTGQSRQLPLSYCRAIEVGRKAKNRGLHIHVLLMTNGHAFHSLGDYSSKEGLAKRSLSTLVREAWASALFGFDRTRSEYPANDWRSNIPNFKHIERVFDQSLVNFGRAWSERHRKGEDVIEFHYSQMIDVIFAASYLCKADTKYFKDGTHPFRCSRSKGAPSGVQGDINPVNAKGKGLGRTVSEENYHRGNENLPLIRFESGEHPILNALEGAYIYPDLCDAWSYLDKLGDVSNDFAAIRFGVDIDENVLKLKKRNEFVERLYIRIERSIRHLLGQRGKANVTDISYLRAINSWQQENGRMFLHIVLLIDGKVFDMLQKNKQYDYFQSFLADELSYAYSWGLSDAEERLSVFSYHRVKERDMKHMNGLRQDVGYLCASEASISQVSTLYLR